MAGYSKTPLWKKLGYKKQVEAYLDGAPEEYLQLLGLPAGLAVAWMKRPHRGMKFIHLFSREATKLKTKLAALRRQIASDGVIWVSWPKKSSGVESDITEDTVRAIALPMGLVDIKVCAVDEVWSGLKLMIRKSERGEF